MNDKWKFYKDADNKWRWRVVASNGSILEASTEGYTRRVDCARNARNRLASLHCNLSLYVQTKTGSSDTGMSSVPPDEPAAAHI